MSFKTLLIYDESGAHDLLASALSAAGCDETWVARSCTEAGTLITRDRIVPDLVIVDLALDPTAELSIMLVAKRLRDVPIIVVANETLVEGAYDGGLIDYVTRPIRAVDLQSRLRAALRMRSERSRRAARERTLTEKVRRLEHENQELERLVCVDSLTGVANRRHVLALLDGEWKRAARSQTCVSLVIIDLDFFHAFNETYGHPGGDACLRRVSEAMVSCLRRPSDFLGRYGGEEFLAVLASTDASGAQIVAERLRTTIEALAIPHEASPARRVTISAGFATLTPSAGTGIAALVSTADDALLRAKAEGRNRVIGDAPLDAIATRTADTWWSRFPVVVVDPWFADRIPKFLRETGDDARLISNARGRACTFDRIQLMARRLKAAARDYGFDQIRHYAMLLERAARLESREDVREAADDLAQYADRVQVTYRRAPEASPEPSVPTEDTRTAASVDPQLDATLRAGQR